jgi:hypothetical protein
VSQPAPPTPDLITEPLPKIPKRTLLTRARDYFLGETPTLLTALVPTCFLSMLLYTRHPATNFIFDEQEALLANPYVRASAERGSPIGWLQAFHRDFWGLTPDRTIGSYRPLPDIVWRVLWRAPMFREQSAFPHAYVNVLIHGLNGALVVLLVARWTRDRLTAWLAGGIFVATAVVTEAVSGVVGLADVLGGAGVLLALLSLSQPLTTMPFALAGATLLGLYSKESALCIVPLAPLAALLLSHTTHARPRRWLRAAVAALATGGAFVFYVEMRRRWFPVTIPVNLTVEANASKPVLQRAFATALRWYAQPILPHDPLNNPLIEASLPYRVAGALRVFARGLGQVVYPSTLSGDYSAPQEPVPARLIFPESVLGALAMVLPLVACPVLAFRSFQLARRRARAAEVADGAGAGPGLDPQLAGPTWAPDPVLDSRPLIGFAMVWIVVSYLPVSNIPVVLPTVRAERFWYFPAIGSAILLSVAFCRLLQRSRGGRWFGPVVAFGILYFTFQCVAARRHAFDYTNDLVFWDATRKSVPRSAKAHLNYSVMLGARGDLSNRLAANDVALRLAPDWPMASVYMGDTLCRMHRAPEAVPHYLRGFALGPNDMSLVALGLQCLWDENQLGEESPLRSSLQEVADRAPGSWLKYLVDDTFANGDEYHGVNPKYRPRGYNEGPKKDE